jgi:hypothetical protein
VTVDNYCIPYYPYQEFERWEIPAVRKDNGMRLRRTAAIYSILVGLAIIATWIILLSTGQVPELETAPLPITFHIIAEFITAAILLAGGIGLILSRTWAFNIYLLSMGMLIYAVVNASGLYAQRGNMAMIVVFIVVIIIAIILTVCLLTKGRADK